MEVLESWTLKVFLKPKNGDKVIPSIAGLGNLGPFRRYIL